MKTTVTLLALWMLTSAAWAQTRSTASSKKSKSSPSASARTPETPSAAPAVELTNRRYLPLWGSGAKNARQLAEDESFLQSCDANFGSRTEASSFFAERGWEYIAEGQLDTATYRFNLAHLLDERNADPYWGLGVICHQKGQSDEAIKLLSRGLTVDTTKAMLYNDLATLHLNRYGEDSLTAHLTTARQLLERSLVLDSTNADTFQKLSLQAYYAAQYPESWKYLHQARNLDMQSMDFNLINQLLSKAPDPLGVFKQQN
jgi:tetratricopeptide (TPR) repeat protein